MEPYVRCDIWWVAGGFGVWQAGVGMWRAGYVTPSIPIPVAIRRLGGTALVTDDTALAFIQRHLKSVWALELLLLFHNNPGREWRRDELVRELRGSEAVVNEALSQLKGASLVGETSERMFKYEPASPSLRETVSAIAEIYSTHPMAVIKAISASPSEKLQIFSDAFKIRDT